MGTKKSTIVTHDNPDVVRRMAELLNTFNTMNCFYHTAVVNEPIMEDKTEPLLDREGKPHLDEKGEPQMVTRPVQVGINTTGGELAFKDDATTNALIAEAAEILDLTPEQAKHILAHQCAHSTDAGRFSYDTALLPTE